jgi:hypothetical protein
MVGITLRAGSNQSQSAILRDLINLIGQLSATELNSLGPDI